MRTSRGGMLALAFLFLPLGLSFSAMVPPAASAAEPGASPAFQTLAVADPAVLGPEPGDAWLGAAVAELLKAKLQFLKKVRLVERERLEPHLAQLRDAGRDEEEAGADRRRAALLVPAEAFCVGSITVDRRGEAARLAVRLRLVQTATGTVLAKMTVEAASDLPGLLSLAGQLAQELAAALGETLDASALAYREPERLDALKLHAEGLQRLAAGEHREAVAALTAALEGNGGVFYPAAHRDLGAVYRAWAQSLTGAAAEGVRQEYLERFKQDALLAATALFDLGVAYQENGLHQEAIAAFTDYLAAVGEEGKRARWSLTRLLLLDAVARLPGAPSPSGSGVIDWAGFEGEVLHLLFQGLWVRVDAKTGVPLAAIPLTWPLATHGFQNSTIRVSGGRLVISAFDEIAVVAPDGAVAWKKKVGLNIDYGRGDAVERGMVIRRDGRTVSIYSLEDGSPLGEIPERHEAPLFGLDLAGNRFSGSEGARSLPGGALIAPSPLTVKGSLYDWRKLPLPGIRYATGIPAFEWMLAQDATPQRPEVVLLRDGAVTQTLGVACTPQNPAWQAALPGGRFLLFSCVVERLYRSIPYLDSQYVLVDTRDGVTRTLFKGVGELPALTASGGDQLVFSFRMTYPREDAVLRGEQGLVPNERAGAFVVVDAIAGRVVGRERTGREEPLCAAVHDGDLVLATSQHIARLRMPRGRGPVLIPAGDAHLRIAESLIERGDLTTAARSIQAFATETPGDPREHLALMRLEVARARSPEASTHALAALRNPTLDDRDIRACLDVLHRTNPEYRSFIRLPAGVGQPRLRGMTDDGVIVAQDGDIWHLVDSTRGTVRSVASPFGREGVLRLDQGEPQLFRFVLLPAEHHGREQGYWSDRHAGPWQLQRLDLLTGAFAAGAATTAGPPPVANLEQSYQWLDNAGIPPSVLIGRKQVMDLSRGAGSSRQFEFKRVEQDAVLVVMDPQTLGEHHRVVVGPGGLGPLTFSQRLVVFGDPVKYVGNGQPSPPLRVLRRSDGSELTGVEVALRNEMIIGAVTDEATLFVGIAGVENNAFLAGDGGLWFRVEAYPVGPDGVRWSYRSDGYLASNPILEQGRLSFAAVPTLLPRPRVKEDTGEYLGLAARSKLSLVRLDARSGALLGAAPWVEKSASPLGRTLHPLREGLSAAALLLVGMGGVGQYTDPLAPRVFFPGSEGSVWGNPLALLEYLFPPAGTPALELEPGSLERNVFLDVRARFIVRDGTVYEAFGQGLILVKDYGDGAWMTPFTEQ